MSKRILIPAGAILAALSVLCFAILNRFTVSGEVFSFSSYYKGSPVSLEATLWRAENAGRAVLICPGYSCDRQKWRPFANIFLANGISVMVFDYAGQGASGGAIGFDNAKTDDIPLEISDAMTELTRRTGIPDSDIILLGHSMGGRAILRMLCDINRTDMVTEVSRHDVRNVILMSPEVNYVFSAQASLFAGTSDDTQEPWASLSPADIGGVRIFLYGSTADDVVSAECVRALSERLGEACETGITGGVLHSYQMYSPRFAGFVNGALESITGTPSAYNAGEQLLTYAGWFAALSGMYLLFKGLNCGSSFPGEAMVLPEKGFIRKKLLLWLPGIAAAVLICGACVFMPFGSPVMNIPYMCFISGYGIAMLIYYRRRLPKPGPVSLRGLLRALIVTACAAVYICWILRASMYRLPQNGIRTVWLVICGCLMTAGYYVSGCESDALAAAKKPVRAAYRFVQYVPLILFALFYLAIGSYSGLIAQAVNILLMYILFVPMGDYVKNASGSRIAGAAVTGFMFQAFMITSAALIAF